MAESIDSGLPLQEIKESTEYTQRCGYLLSGNWSWMNPWLTNSSVNYRSSHLNSSGWEKMGVWNCEPILEPLTSERNERPMLSTDVFVHAASILFDPSHSILYTQERSFLNFFFRELPSSHSTPGAFQEEWGLSLDRLGGWWVLVRRFYKLQTAVASLKARNCENIH
jgi:hypothetical protein